MLTYLCTPACLSVVLSMTHSVFSLCVLTLSNGPFWSIYQFIRYHAKAVAPLLEQGLPLMCASLDRALSAGQIFPSSAEKKTGKRKSAGAKSSAAKSAAAAVAARDRARSTSAPLLYTV